MEVNADSYLPGDSVLVDKIVYELKSQGIFDDFRKECISDVDTKPAYQNLRQRVENNVAGFLRKQKWRPDLNKNQLRESLRNSIYDSGFLETGVERIVDQVVNPKINTIFLPKVTEIVYNFLGIKKPKENTKDTTQSLLPTDLEAVSPESVHSDAKDENKTLIQTQIKENMIKKDCENKRECDEDKKKYENLELKNENQSENHNSENIKEENITANKNLSSEEPMDIDKNEDEDSFDGSKNDEDESPPFEPLEQQDIKDSFIQPEDNSIDSHLSNFSNFITRNSSYLKQMDVEASNQDSCVSKQSSDDHLSIVVSEDTTTNKMDICNDSMQSSRSQESIERNFDFFGKSLKMKSEKYSRDDKNIDGKKYEEKMLEEKKMDDKKLEEKKSGEKKIEKSEEKKLEKTEEKNSEEKKSEKHKSERHSFKHERHSESRSSSDGKKESKHSDKKDRKEYNSKSKDGSKGDRKDYKSEKDKRDHRSSKENERHKNHRSADDKSHKNTEDKNKKEKTDREKHEKMDDKNEKDKIKKERIEREKERNGKSYKEKSDKDKERKDRDKELNEKDKHDKEKYERDKNEKNSSNKERKTSLSRHDSNSSINKDKQTVDKKDSSSKSRKEEKNKDDTRSKDEGTNKDETRNKDDTKNKGETRSKDETKVKNKEDPKHKNSGIKDHKSRESNNKNKEDKSRPKKENNNTAKYDSKYDSSSGNKRDDKHRSSKKSTRDKDRNHKKEKKEIKDDHYSSKDKKTDRRSTDRDSNDGDSTAQNSSASLSGFSATLTHQNRNKNSSGNLNSNSGDSGNSENNESDSVKVEDTQKLDNSLPRIKILKPKFASNIYEARKLMKIRKKLLRLEKQGELQIAQKENKIVEKIHLDDKYLLNKIDKDTTLIGLKEESNLDKKSKIRGLRGERKHPVDNLQADNSKVDLDSEIVLKSSIVSAATWNEMEAQFNKQINYDSYLEEYEGVSGKISSTNHENDGVEYNSTELENSKSDMSTNEDDSLRKDSATERKELESIGMASKLQIKLHKMDLGNLTSLECTKKHSRTEEDCKSNEKLDIFKIREVGKEIEKKEEIEKNISKEVETSSILSEEKFEKDVLKKEDSNYILENTYVEPEINKTILKTKFNSDSCDHKNKNLGEFINTKNFPDSPSEHFKTESTSSQENDGNLPSSDIRKLNLKSKENNLLSEISQSNNEVRKRKFLNIEDFKCFYLPKESSSTKNFRVTLNYILKKLKEDLNEHEAKMSRRKTVCGDPAIVDEFKVTGNTTLQLNMETKMRGSKRKFLDIVDQTDLHNNNNKGRNNCHAEVSTQNYKFSLPLSPAESDQSFDEKFTKISFIKKGSTTNSQRYSSEDLYKPRPVVRGSRRRGKGTID